MTAGSGDTPEPTASTSGTVGEAGFVPLTVEEARALMGRAAGIDRDALLAERAEAEAQLRAAEATLGLGAQEAGHAQGDDEQEQEEPAQKPHNVDGGDVDGWLDVEALRAAAVTAREADDELARAASEAERPRRSGPSGSAPERLGAAESALARALELREELPAAWRRLVGAMISATGMAIVIGALGWNAYWLLVPTALIAVMTVDLRLADRAAREASAEASGELAEVGEAGPDVLEDMRRQREQTGATEARLARARAERDAAYDRFEELAPGRLPSEVDKIVTEYEAELAARREAAARPAPDAAVGAAPDGEGEATGTPAPEPAGEDEPTPAPVVATSGGTGEPVAAEWWFGSKEPPPVPAAASGSVRALAERLSAEGREALARIEAQLDALDRVELARRSLEWHEQNGSSDGNPEPSPGPAREQAEDGAPGGSAKPPRRQA